MNVHISSNQLHDKEFSITIEFFILIYFHMFLYVSISRFFYILEPFFFFFFCIPKTKILSNICNPHVLSSFQCLLVLSLISYDEILQHDKNSKKVTKNFLNESLQLTLQSFKLFHLPFLNFFMIDASLTMTKVEYSCFRGKMDFPTYQIKNGKKNILSDAIWKIIYWHLKFVFFFLQVLLTFRFHCLLIHDIDYFVNASNKFSEELNNFLFFVSTYKEKLIK